MTSILRQNFRVADCRLRISDSAVRREVLNAIEIALLSTLVLATRCANYQDVFVAGNIYFSDADCYARMTRVQMVNESPALILRHHAFENFPDGTTPHTTAPLDYLIFALSLGLRPFTAHPLDLAGALISPLLALLLAWFLWWWSRRMHFRYRWVMLIVYATSPILVQATQLGRPDHQSLLMLLVAIAICAVWASPNAHSGKITEHAIRESRMPLRRCAWWVAGTSAWALAIWVSAYEPLLLFFVVVATLALTDTGAVWRPERRAGWVAFLVIAVIALVVERRIPSLSVFCSDAIFTNWTHTIGELTHVSPDNPIWLRWCGYLLLIAPLLVWMSVRMGRNGAPGGRALPVYILLIEIYLFTIWQARWGYFFVLVFAIVLPDLLMPIRSRAAVWIAFVLSMFPILRDWDERLWPNEAQLATRVERRIEAVQVRDIALNLQSPHTNPFLAPWWLSPSIAYCSGQPGVSGSSHESLSGIEASARFFLSENLEKAHEILRSHGVVWVFAYDSDRVAQNSAAVLDEKMPLRPLCRILDRTPTQAPRFLILSAQNSVGKLYRSAVEHSE